MTIPPIWSTAGWSCREEEARAVDPARARRLKADGWGYVEVLLVDGVTEVNRGNLYIERAVASCAAVGLPLVGWATPRPQHHPVDATVALLDDARREYGLAGVRYQTETEFEYSGAGGPSGYGQMDALGQAHHRIMGSAVPASVYARGSLTLADAAWISAWHYGMRPVLETYGWNETPVPAGYAPRPDFPEPVARESALPPLTGGWSYRVKLGKAIVAGRVSDDVRQVQTVLGRYPIGTSAGPRFIAQAGDAKWGAVLGFFPTSWLKIAVSAYANIEGTKPLPGTLAQGIRTFQATVDRFGDRPLGYTLYAGPEMTEAHYVALAPRALVGAALIP